MKWPYQAAIAANGTSMANAIGAGVKGAAPRITVISDNAAHSQAANADALLLLGRHGRRFTEAGLLLEK